MSGLSQQSFSWLDAHLRAAGVDASSAPVRAARVDATVRTLCAEAERLCPRPFLDAVGAGGLLTCTSARQSATYEARAPATASEFQTLVQHWLDATAKVIGTADLHALFALLAHLDALRLDPLASIVASHCCQRLVAETDPHQHLLPHTPASDWPELELDALRYETGWLAAVGKS